MHNFFIRDEEQKIAEQSTHMDDIDLVMSPIDGKLVVVAMRGGEHVCQRCGGPISIDSPDPKVKGVEVHFKEARVLLHPNCQSSSSRRLFFQNVQGVQVRRRIAQVAKQTQGLADAAENRKKSVVG